MPSRDEGGIGRDVGLGYTLATGRLFCDHCNYDVTDTKRLYQATVKIDPPPGTNNRGLSQKSLDLCVDCAAALKRAVERPQINRAAA